MSTDGTYALIKLPSLILAGARNEAKKYGTITMSFSNVTVPDLKVGERMVYGMGD